MSGSCTNRGTLKGRGRMTARKQNRDDVSNFRLTLGFRIEELEKDGLTMPISGGPSIHQIEHCLFVPELRNQVPVHFQLVGKYYATVSVRLRMMHRYDEDVWIFLGALDCYHRAIPPERPDLRQATVYISNYSSHRRSGFMLISPYVQKRLERGDSLI